MSRIVFCPLCGSGNTWLMGYEDGYDDEKPFGVGEMWLCEACSHLFEIEEAEEEWDSDFDLDDGQYDELSEG